MFIIFFILILLYGYKIYYEKNKINNDIYKQTHQTSHSLANLAKAYKNAIFKKEDLKQFSNNTDTDIEFFSTNELENYKNTIFEHFYDLNNSLYQVGMFKVKNTKKIISQNIKKAIEYFKNNENESEFFYEFANAKYFYAQKDANDLMIIISSDNSQNKANDIKKLWQKIALECLGLLVLLLIGYLIYRKNKYNFKQCINSLNQQLKLHEHTILQKDETLNFRFYNDVLTGLPNRNQLIKDLDNNDDCVALALINIDSFKEINDFYGFEIGDEILISFAGLLKLYHEEYCYTIYKLHADEYALLWQDNDKEKINFNINKLLNNIQNFSVMTEDENNIQIGVTAGIAISTSSNNSILAHADMILKRAKSKKLSYLFFEEDMKIEKEYKYNIEWTTKTKEAIKNEKIVAYAQPIVNTQNLSEAKYEVLIRMLDFDQNPISPISFLEVAKKNKLYEHLTKIMVEKSFSYFTNKNIQFSINLSILDILNQKTVDTIIYELKRFSNPKNITFELLESEGIENSENVLKFINKVKAFGCNIAIDDFGSGYSNFEYMLRLQVDLIKIDASLIKDIDTNINAQIIVQTIVSFADKLGIKTCAEFVHSESVYKKLLEIGTTFVQGYYIQKPMPLEDIKG